MIDNTKNTQISVFDIKIKRIFVANNVLLNNTIMKKLLLLAFVLCSSLLCRAQEERVILGDEQTSEYFPILKDKRIAIFSNHTGMIGDKHLLDILLENKFNVVAIFSPEHGFRGDADAGEHVSSSVDKKTGVPILSLYDGKSGKPSEASMRKFDILVVDIQDVGLRFYTYYASMCRLMDACAEYNRKVLILDRPNPNGHYVDGPILDMKYKSGVGWLPIPVVHGMTLGELYDLIIADEITASLDPDTSGQIMENLLALPCMVVAITHDVSGAFMKQFDKVYRVEHGSVTQA